MYRERAGIDKGPGDWYIRAVTARTLALAALVLCAGAAPKQVLEPRRYIGLKYHARAMPPGLKHLGGWTLGSAHSVSEVARGELRMLWLERLIGRDKRGRPSFEVLDVLVLPAIAADESLAHYCARDGAEDGNDLVAIAKDASPKKDRYSRLLRAWFLDTGKGRIEPVPVEGVSCFNTAFEAQD